MLGNIDEFFKLEELQNFDFALAKPAQKYWLTQLKSVPKLKDKITQKDEECLQFLEHIQISQFSASFDFSLIFEFRQNPFFSDPQIELSFEYNDQNIFHRMTASKISWLPGGNLCSAKSINVKKNKVLGTMEQVEENFAVASFFQIFDQKPKKKRETAEICEMMVFLKEIVVKYGPFSYFGVKVPEFEIGSKLVKIRRHLVLPIQNLPLLERFKRNTCWV